MNIQLVTRYFNNWNAGIGVYSKNILREMIKRGHNVAPVSTKTEGTIGYFKYTSFDLFREMKVPSPFSEKEIDLYHALTPMESIWLPKEKTVTTFHDLIPMLHREEETWYFEGWFSSFRRWFGSKWFEYGAKKGVESERIICNSEHTKRKVMENLGYNDDLRGVYHPVSEDKISVIRLGVSDDLELKNPTSFDEADFTVGTLSYLDPRKRIDILIKAFKNLQDPNAELLIPSTGPDEKRLKRIAGGDERIKFLGYIDEEDKADYLSSLDVFVLPSKLEGYGLPFVEAMACKTPVVSLDDALIPSDVQDRTHVVSKVNLPKLLFERDFDCDVGRNYEFAQKHDWEKCAERTEEVYEEVLE